MDPTRESVKLQDLLCDVTEFLSGANSSLEATREWFRAFTAILSQHVALNVPGEAVAAYTQFLRD